MEDEGCGWEELNGLVETIAMRKREKERDKNEREREREEREEKNLPFFTQ